MFKVISRDKPEAIRTVYAVDPVCDHASARFLIYIAGRWYWVDSRYYRPYEPPEERMEIYERGNF